MEEKDLSVFAITVIGVVLTAFFGLCGIYLNYLIQQGRDIGDRIHKHIDEHSVPPKECDTCPDAKKRHLKKLLGETDSE